MSLLNLRGPFCRFASSIAHHMIYVYMHKTLVHEGMMPQTNLASHETLLTSRLCVVDGEGTPGLER